MKATRRHIWNPFPSLKAITLTVMALGTISATDLIAARIVVGHDVNTFGTDVAGLNEARFAVNVATFLTVGHSTKNLLMFESSPGDGARDFSPVVLNALISAGFSITVTSDYATPFIAFDALFVAQRFSGPGFLPNQDLITYVNTGGGVYLAGGVGPSPFAEAAGWSAFLSYFGLGFQSDAYNNLGVVYITSKHSIFTGVSSLYCGIGSNIILGNNPNASIVQTQSGGGLYAVVEDSNVSILPSIPLDPRRTYLRFNAALDVDPVNHQDPPLGPLILDLAANGIAPGDYLFLERSGRFGWSAAFSTEEGRNVWAVFSSNSTVDDNPELDHPEPKRIRGAIRPEGLPEDAFIVTGPTLANSQEVGSPTDIPEDFMADRVLVKVPVAATHLMFGAGDVKWADNVDGPPADFQIAVTQIRDPLFDTDGDGFADLDEIFSGTDCRNPSSHLSLDIFSSPVPTHVRTTWTAMPFRIYQIEEATVLPSFGPIESLPTVTVPTPMQRDYLLTPVDHFYRLRVIGMFWD